MLLRRFRNLVLRSRRCGRRSKQRTDLIEKAGILQNRKMVVSDNAAVNGVRQLRLQPIALRQAA